MIDSNFNPEMQNPKPRAEIRSCGCWIVNLAQGKMILACKDHEPKILEIIIDNACLKP